LDRIKLPENKTPIGRMFLMYFSLYIQNHVIIVQLPMTLWYLDLGIKLARLTVISIVSSPFISGVNNLNNLVPTA
jgi:hypothetical protein